MKELTWNIPPTQDYADWLTPARLEIEEKLWRESKLYLRYAGAIRRMMGEFPKIQTVLEFGAGTGWIPAALSDLPIESYALVDRNQGCLDAARARHVDRGWVTVLNHEIRDLQPAADLVCGFAVLKHFRLDEWVQLFGQLFGTCEYGLFTVPMAPLAVEDGVEFTHTRISPVVLWAALQKAGVQEIWRDNTDPQEPLIAVRRVWK